MADLYPASCQRLKHSHYERTKRTVKPLYFSSQGLP